MCVFVCLIDLFVFFNSFVFWGVFCGFFVGGGGGWCFFCYGYHYQFHFFHDFNF